MCDFGFICNTTDGSCVADCNEFEMDGYLSQCSMEFDNTEQRITLLEQNVSDLTDCCNDNTQRITSLEQTISDLMSRIDTLEQQTSFDELS